MIIHFLLAVGIPFFVLVILSIIGFAMLRHIEFSEKR